MVERTRLSQVSRRELTSAAFFFTSQLKWHSISSRIQGLVGIDLWQKASSQKEMKIIECIFEFPEDRKPPICYPKIDCHMVSFKNIKLTLK